MPRPADRISAARFFAYSLVAYRIIGGVARARGPTPAGASDAAFSVAARASLEMPPSRPPSRLAIRADLLDFVDDPGFAVDPGPAAVRFLPDGWLLVEEQRIAAALPADQDPGAGWTRLDRRGQLLLPGFIDTHVHAPQLDVIASFGTELLDWLRTYTFPAEQRYADPEVAEAGAERFLDALLASGVTAAAVFPTVHRISAETLFASAQRRGMRLITGKVLMDRNSPDALRDRDVAGAERDCVDLIERWHGRDRLGYAVTPRFAPTSSDDQLALCGRLLRDYAGRAGGLYLQTHLAENRAEVDWVRSLFPQARSYLDVYARHDLLGPRSIFAHGIWLDPADRAALAEAGAQIAFCPSSNLFLGSGLFGWGEADAARVAVTLASDVGGGTSLCPLRTMADAYKAMALRGERLTAWKALYSATRGAARALGLEHEIGHFGAGTMADFTLWHWAHGPVQQRRQDMARNLHERVFAWMLLGDERNLVASHVGGRQMYAS